MFQCYPARISSHYLWFLGAMPRRVFTNDMFFCHNCKRKTVIIPQKWRKPRRNGATRGRVAAVLCSFLCDSAGSVEADTDYPNGAGSVSLSGRGCGDLTLFRGARGGLWPSAFACCHRASSCSLSLSFVQAGLLANFQCAKSIKGRETGVSARRKRKRCSCFPL